MGMREAFLDAAKKNPDSKLAREARKALPAINRDIKKKVRTQALFREVDFLGYAYFSLVIDRFRAESARQKLGIDIDGVKSRWQQVQDRLLELDIQERVTALECLATGMKVLRDRPHPVIEGIQQAASFISTKGRGFEENVFSRDLDFSSRVFAVSFSELSGYNLIQTISFLGLLSSRMITPQPDMLRQTISVVAEVLPLINPRLR